VRSILVDTGPIVALIARADAHHRRLATFLKRHPCTLLTTWPVMTEAWHLVHEDARLRLARWALVGGVHVFDLGEDAPARLLALLETYHDRPMDLADASLVLLAERTGIEEILTIDRSDFDTYRLPGGKRFLQVFS
jgi:uncharacterized protein